MRPDHKGSELTMRLDLQDPNNLNRIRNNQRRSRARRKEYLQELEEKLRKCEIMGVEASMEIQASARLVAEENKRLRALLQSRGIMGHDIDAALGMSGAGVNAPQSTEMLEAKLNTKKPCVDRECNKGCSPPQPGTLSLTSTTSAVRGSTYKRPVALMPLTTVLTNPSSLPTSPALRNRLSSSSLTSNSIATPAFSSTEPSLPFGNHYNHASPDLSAEISLGNDTSSCTFAASIIATMRADVSAEDVKADLGCGKDAECKIDNATFFTAMDRYTA